MLRCRTCLILAVFLLFILAGPSCAKPWERVSMLNIVLVKTNSSGMEIQVIPRDTKGNIIPLTGTINAKLYVYDNPRGCGLCEGEYKQEWTEIVLNESSYERENGARLKLPFNGFFPDTFTLAALDVTLAEGSNSLYCLADRLAIGTEVFS